MFPFLVHIVVQKRLDGFQKRDGRCYIASQHAVCGSFRQFKPQVRCNPCKFHRISGIRRPQDQLRPMEDIPLPFINAYMKANAYGLTTVPDGSIRWKVWRKPVADYLQ